jgi:hypothetical protein
MGNNLAANAKYGDIMAKHLQPGDEAAILRYAAALEEIREGISKGPGKFFTSMMASTAVGTAAEYARDAANAFLLRRPSGHSSKH